MAKLKKNANWKDFPSIMADLKKGSMARIYLVSGSERFLIDKLIAAMKQLWIEKGAESLDFYQKDAANAKLTVEEFQSLCGSPPFMSKCRLTVIRNAGLWASNAPASAAELDKWKQALTAVPEFSSVVFVEDKIDKRKKQLIDAVSLNGELIEISLQEENTLVRWIKASLDQKGITVSQECMASLISRTDSSMRMIENETMKIVLYCEYTGTKQINMEMLDRLCIPDVHASVFQMMDAIGERKTGRAMEILNDLILIKEPIPKIRLMLSRHIRQLICAKEIGDAKSIATRLKVHPFVAGKLVKQARLFTMEQLQNQYFRCFESDFAVKSGKMDDRMSMEVLLAGCVEG